jgi:sugar phosphate isomerase/epimerase
MSIAADDLLAATTPRLKGRFPFRLGTTSYILPADIEPNVRALAPHVDDIELVLFESEAISNLPDARTVAALAELAGAQRLSYTVHLPLDTQLGAADEAVRRASVDKCLRVIRLTRPLEPHAWIVHFHGERRGQAPAADPKAWRNRLERSAAELLAEGIPPALVAVETLDYPFELVLPIVEDHGLSVCADIGHLVLNGRDPLAAMAALRERCRVVHLHGVRDGQDHVDIGALGRPLLDGLRRELERVPGEGCVVTLEVFSQAHFERSMQILTGVWT